MKKKYWKIITGMCLAICCTHSIIVSAEEQTPVQMASEEESQNTVISYLTGEQVSADIGRRRPIAIMLGNSQTACPQSGISNAGVIYEAPVEGDMTRLMAVIEDYDSLEKIGSVRSCRDYYLFYASEFNSIYAHFGQAAYALPYLNQHVIDNLNGLQMDGTTFFRTSDRQAPHNAYASGTTLTQGIQSLGYSQDYRDDYTGHYLFVPEGTENLLETGVPAATIHFDNFGDNRPWFEYDSTSGKYKRFQFGAPQVDELTNEQLQCDNILVQFSAYQVYDAKGYLNIDATSGGSGKYFTRGKCIDIRWEKDSPWGVTHYFDSNNQEIHLNQGKTWVEIVLNDEIASVTYQ